MKNFILIIIIFIFTLNLAAQFNNPKSTNKNKQNYKVSRFAKLNSKVERLQFVYRNQMSKIAREIKKEGNYTPIFTLLFFSFLYGIIHSLGPGHGKVITGSYFLSEKTKIKKGIIAGFSFGFLHAISGLILVSILYAIKTRKLQRSAEISTQIQMISLVIIIILGVFLLIKHILEFRNSDSKKDNQKSLFAMILALGLIPCPGSVIVALFSINIEMFWLGILMVLTMALGMSITISTIGVLMISFRNIAENISVRLTATAKHISPLIGIIGSLLMIGFGILFLI